MELLLKRNENPRAFGTSYDLFAKLELNDEELARFRKAQTEKTLIIEDEYEKNYYRWLLMLIPAGFAAIIVGILVMMVLTSTFLGFLAAIFSVIPIRRLIFNQTSGNVTVGDIITGRTIHCKSLDELLVKEDDIRTKIIKYCKNFEALHDLGSEQRIKLDEV
jgi:hypothetical protein